MLANYKTATYQETRRELGEEQAKGNLNTTQAVKDFLKEKGYDYQDFVNEENRYEKDFLQQQKEEQEKSVVEKQLLPESEVARPEVTGLGIIDSPVRVTGRAVGDATKGIQETLATFFPSLEEKRLQVGDYLRDILPESVQRFVAQTMDPYHGGEGLGATVEETLGKIGSYFVGYGAVTKGLQGVAKITPGARSVMTRTSRKLKPKYRKAARLAGAGLRFGAGTTIVEDPEENLVNVLNEQFPESFEFLERYTVDPTDKKSKQYLDALVNNLVAEGVLTAGIATVGGLAKLYKTIRKNKTITGRSPISSLSSRMGVDDSTLNKLIKRDNASKAAAIRADGLASDLEKSLKTNKKKLDNENFTLEDVDLALKGDQTKLNQLTRIAPKSADILKNMRDNIDELSEFVSSKVGGELKATIDRNLKTYVNTSYKIFDDPAYRKEITKRIKKGDVDDTVVQNAMAYIKSQLGAGATDEIATKELLELVTDKSTRDFFKSLGTPGGYTLMGSSKPLRAKKGEDKFNVALKDLYGEIKSPFRNYITTFNKLSTIKAEQDFLDELASDLVSRNIAKVSETGRGVSGLVKVEQAAKERLDKIFGKNLTEGKKMTLIDEETGNIVKSFITKPNVKNPFKDVYVNEDYVKAIREGLNSLEKPGEGLFNTAYSAFLKAKGVSQVAKTIYSPSTHGRNVLGNVMIMGANGMIPFGKTGKDAFSDLSKRFIGVSTKDLNEKLARYSELGITDSGIGLGTIRDNLNDFLQAPNKFLDQSIVKKSLEAPKVFNKKLFQLYQAEDDIFKIMHFEKTKDYLKKAYPNIDNVKLEEMAAARTRDLMPNYALVPKLFKQLRGLPVGDFLSFPAEMMRISKNLMTYTLDDLASGNLELTKQGAKRLAGLTTVGISGDYLKNKSMMLMGIDKDQDEAINNNIPYFEQDYSRIYLSPIQKKQDGTVFVDYVNLGPIDPFEYLKSAARMTQDAVFSNKPVKAEEAMFKIIERTLSPFLGPSMIVENFLDLRVNPDSSDLRTGAIAKGIGGAFVKTFEPGFVSNLKKNFQAYNSRKVRGDDFGVYDKGLRSIPDGDIDLMAHLGVRRQRFDMTASIPYNFLPTMRAYSRPDTELRELLRKGVGANVSRDDLGRAYDKAQQNRSADMLKLRALIKDYEAMGMDFTEIVNAFSRGGAFPDKELGETMRGVLESSKLNNFIPLPFKEEQTAESMYGINVPYDLFQDIYNHYEGRTVE
tara:strand:- start:261 stop:3947 length:3687 start_codon:yes stop_codon:yes gene_type:complete